MKGKNESVWNNVVLIISTIALILSILNSKDVINLDFGIIAFFIGIINLMNGLIQIKQEKNTSAVILIITGIVMLLGVVMVLIGVIEPRK